MPNQIPSDFIPAGQRLIALLLTPYLKQQTPAYRRDVTDAIQAFRLLCDLPHTTEEI